MTKPHGYPKYLRLSGRDDIGAAYRLGRYHRLGVLHAKALPTQRDTPRFLISVKKAIGTAAERNRIKRLVREAIRRHRDQLQHAHDVCVFLTSRPRRTPTLAEIDAEIVQLLRRLDAGA
ncbi:MAG TPA: ribonuclease P protein component [bacterium]